MGYYINCIKKEGALSRDIKELVPNMNIRRRMSRVMKMGVLTALDSLADFEEYGSIDAIITSTWLGCIADSEKFLANMIESDEKMLNPTPFIQSTFNTVGGQVALIKSLHCYNNTFSQRQDSFDSASLDAFLQMEHAGKNAVLLGVFDEMTPTVETICKRLNLSEIKGEGAVFFVLSKEKLPCSVAEISNLQVNVDINKNLAKQEWWSGALAEKIYDTVNAKQDANIVSNSISFDVKCC